MTTLSLFPGFERRRIKTSGAMINLVIGGDGPPLLLLHGNPQTHVMWHKVAPSLARDYTVVCADLRGYGDSSKPRGLPGHANYSKRAMALDMAEAMESLGYLGFHVVGHDRGGRVAHRLARDFGRRVRSLTVLDISLDQNRTDLLRLPARAEVERDGLRIWSRGTLNGGTDALITER